MSNNTRKSVVKYVGHEDGVSSGGHPQLVIDLLVVEGTDAGKTRTAYYILNNEKGYEFAAKAMRALGMSNDDFDNPEGLGDTKAQLVEFYETNEKTGKSNWRARYINPIRGRAIEAMDDSARSTFASLMKDALRSEDTVKVNDANRAPEVVTPAATTTVGSANDELGF